MNRVRNGIACAIIAVGAILGIIYQGTSFLVWDIPVMIGALLLLLALVILFFCGVVTALRRKPFGNRIQSVGIIWCVCALSLFLFVALVNAAYVSEYYSIRAYVAEAVPVLNAIKAKTGTYPAKLPTSELGKPPSVLSYSGGKDGFCFQYFESGGFGDLYIFLSSNGGWKHLS